MARCMDCLEWFDDEELDHNSYCATHSSYVKCNGECGEWFDPADLDGENLCNTCAFEDIKEE